MSGGISATTLAVASLGLTAVGTGLSVVGMVSNQQAMGAQANYQRSVALRNQNIAEQNAKIAEQQKQDALDRGKIAEQQQRTKTAQTLGTQQAQLAGQGTDLAGSPTDILADTSRAGEFDALTIRNNAVREAWGYDMKAWNLRSGAGSFGAEADFKGGFQPSYLGAGASLISGASTLADKWSRFQSSGAIGGGGKPLPNFQETY
jgi:hypothetical protein